MPRIAHLVAAYAVQLAIPASPSTEEALMIEPPPFCLHGRGHRLHAEEAAELVDPEEQLDLLERHLLDLAEAQDAGVVGQHVDRPAALRWSPRPARSTTPRR